MSLFSSVSNLFKPSPPPEPEVRAALQRVEPLLDPLLRAVGDFEAQLHAPLHDALLYCAGLVAGLPGPIDISRTAFAHDPLVHALFATADDVDRMLGCSQAVRDYLSDPACLESDHVYAMLAARRQQKRTIGQSLHGHVLQNDVPQTVIYFSDQTLVAPGCSLEKTQQCLRWRALDSLFQTFRTHVQRLRLERDGLRSDLSAERAYLAGPHGDVADTAIHTRHVAELDERLRGMAATLAPEHLVEALAHFLRAPEPSLSLAPVSITIDRLGVLSAPQADDPSVQTLEFPELRGRDQRLYTVFLARVAREEAQAAVERVRDQQHRFMLI